MEVIKECDNNNDQTLLSEAYQLRGLSLFVLGKYKESIDNYTITHTLNPLILNESDMRNLRIAFQKAYSDTITETMELLMNKAKSISASKDAFYVLSQERKYKEAYESLLRYKNEQDSVLSVILKNNVSESVGLYEKTKSIIREEKIRNERMLLLGRG